MTKQLQFDFAEKALEPVEAEVVENEAGEIVWNPYDACAAVEGFDVGNYDEEQILSAWQYLVDLGLVWTLQGWYGRTAVALIEAGLIESADSKSERGR